VLIAKTRERSPTGTVALGDDPVGQAGNTEALLCDGAGSRVRCLATDAEPLDSRHHASSPRLSACHIGIGPSWDFPQSLARLLDFFYLPLGRRH
jgi:hypothetical protein